MWLRIFLITLVLACFVPTQVHSKKQTNKPPSTTNVKPVTTPKLQPKKRILIFTQRNKAPPNNPKLKQTNSKTWSPFFGLEVNAITHRRGSHKQIERLGASEETKVATFSGRWAQNRHQKVTCGFDWRIQIQFCAIVRTKELRIVGCVEAVEEAGQERDD